MSTVQEDRRQGAAEVKGFVTFEVEGQWVGVPVEEVQEILNPQPTSVVPLAPAEVTGFLNVRGQIVTAISLRVRLQLPPRAERGGMNIVVRDQGELFSLLVDSVGDVVEVPIDQVEPTPATLDKHWKACCKGVIRRPQGLLVVMDIRMLLRTGINQAA